VLFKRSTLILTLVAAAGLIAYREWGVLTPFILGGVFAYLLYPLAAAAEKKLKIPWKAAAALVYLVVVGLCFLIISLVGTRLASELAEIARGKGGWWGVWELPPPFQEFTAAIRSSLQALPVKILPYFPGALSKIVSVFIFLVTGFYFLLDGRAAVDKGLNLLPPAERKEVSLILSKINSAVKNYLRGQLFLVFIMTVISYILLSFLEIKYALVLALVIGLAELVPYIGPATAAVSVTLVTTLYSGVVMGVVVGLGYVVLNQLENLIIVPQVVKVTNSIHPLIAMFAVLAGGNSFGILGIILAIPVVSTVKILLEFWFGKITAGEVK
jgi:predicted PurR-regulated permease PerM